MLKRFLTVSALLSAMAASAETKWVNIIPNSDMEGNDAACFASKSNEGGNGDISYVVTPGVGVNGSQGVAVKSVAGAGEDWDAQFWIVLPEPAAAGTKLKVKFDYKASLAVSGIGTQAHGAPGAYQHWACIGDVNFSTEWQSFEKVLVVSGDMAGSAGMGSIAFNLSKDRENDVTFYFDNIAIEVEEEVGEPVVKDWVNVIANSDCEGDDMSAFYTKLYDVELANSTTEAVDGGKAVVVHAGAKVSEAWDNQFFIKAPEALEDGEKIQVSFRYKATKDAKASTQWHSQPTAYKHWAAIGDVNFTTDWQTFEYSGVVPSECGGEGQTIAFNLNEFAEANDYYFDDIVVKVLREVVPEEPALPSEIVNGDFTEGAEGWTMEATGGNWAVKNDCSPAVVEAYAGWGNLDLTDFTMSQKLHLEAGTYKLSAYGFYRYGVGYEVDPAKSCAKLYAGDASVELATLGGIELASYANSMDEASAAFAAGNYLNTLEFTLAEDTDVEVGIAGAHELKQSWIIAGPMTLEKVEAIAPATEDADITTLAWVNEGFDCVNDFNNPGAGTVFGTDAGPSEEGKLSYVDATPYKYVAIYGEAGQTARVFVNRAEMNNDLSVSQFYVEIGENGMGVLDLADVYAKQEGIKYIHLNGVKAQAWNTTLNVSKIMLCVDEPAAPEVEVKPALITEGDYYLVNVGAGQFLQGANDWGTRASMKEAGQLVTLEAYGAGYSINTHIHNSDVQHYLGTNFYVDSDQKAHEFYEVAEGVYVIKNEEGNYLYTDENGFVQGAAEVDENNAMAQWTLVTRDDIKASMAEATKENPVDISSLIYDNNFGRNNRDIEKWEGDTPSKNGDVANFNAEKWGGNSQEFDSYQVLTDMPNGIYKLSAQGYYRYNNTDENTNEVAAAAHADGTEVINSYLYANDVAEPLKSIADEEAVEALGNMPFSQGDASAAFAKGLYQNELTVVVNDGTLRIGVKKTEHPGCDWTVWDNFQLQYLGKANVTTIPEGDYYVYNVGAGQFLQGANSWGTRASIATSGQLVTLTASGEGYTIDTHITNGGDSHYLGTNLYVDAAASVHTFYETGDGHYHIVNADGLFLFTNEGTEIQAAADGDQQGDNAHWILISREEVIASMAEASEDNPVDVSSLIYDPNFGRNNTYFDMWEGDKPGKNGAVENFNAEKWGGNSQEFDSHQTINVPNGIYKLSAQGFYRYNNTNDNTNDIAIAAHADGTEEINSFLYANGAQVPLKSIADDAAAEALGNLPFSQGDASAAFNQGLYQNELKVIVTDGTLTFGVKKTSHPGCDWTVWDNFQLQYLGEAGAILEEGDYYLYNVGAGQYLQGANSWGTRSSLSASGQLVTLAASGEDGYTIDTHITNGGDSHYLGTNLYVDAAAAVHKFYEVGEGKYLIMNSDKAYLYATEGTNEIQGDANADVASEMAMWMLVKADDLVASTEEADKDNAVDLTPLIPDADFGRNNTLIDLWEGDKPGKGGANENMNAEKWGGNSQEFDSHITLNVPNGIYKLSAQGYYRYNNTTDNTNEVAVAAHADGTEEINSYLYANEVAVPLKSIADEEATEALGSLPFSQGDASAAFAKGLYNNELIVKVTDGTLTLGVKKTSHPGCDWTVWDNFRLQYLGTTKPGYQYEPIVIEGTFAKNDGSWNADVDGYTYFKYTAPKAGIVQFTAYGPEISLQVENAGGWADAAYTDEVCVKSQGVEAQAGESVVVRAEIPESDFQLIAVSILNEWPATGKDEAEDEPVEETEGGADAINSVNATNEAVIYDITGRRVNKVVKGNVYIINGKKVVK